MNFAMHPIDTRLAMQSVGGNMSRTSTAITAAVALVLGAVAAGPAQATLVLTTDGVNDGFVLSTFLSGYSPATYGPLAQGILPNGNVVTGSAFGDATARILVFKDVDNQKLSDALISTPYVFGTNNPQYAITTAGGQVYGAQVGNNGGNSVYEQFHNDGSKTVLTIVDATDPTNAAKNATDFLGIWGAPNGHIISASNQGLIDIDPVALSYRVINPNPRPDGVSVSPDGKTMFVEEFGNIDEFRISDGVLLSSFSGNGHAPDGTGVITGGKFNGDIVVNDNDGTVGLIDPTVGTETIIAHNGTRGDFVSPDTSNGTLFLSQQEEIARLSCGPGCSIGSTPTSTPEPATMALFGIGLVGLGVIRRRRKVG
jgi:hypothetical protein